MNDFWAVEPPCVWSFSGGRTSAYMLFHGLRAYGGALPADAFVVFADTGKEHPGTYRFVKDVGNNFGVEIHTVKAEHEGHETPFDAMIARKKYLPNPQARFCTTELKIEPMRKFMKDRGYKYFRNVVGIRADEPTRIKKHALNCDKDFENFLPLAYAEISKPEILQFWKERNFDLDIPPGCGNCVGCFMKGRKNLIAIEQQNPGSLSWYAEKEKQIGGTWRNPKEMESYQKMIDFASNQGQLFKAEDKSIDCMCHD